MTGRAETDDGHILDFQECAFRHGTTNDHLEGKLQGIGDDAGKGSDAQLDAMDLLRSLLGGMVQGDLQSRLYQPDLMHDSIPWIRLSSLR